MKHATMTPTRPEGVVEEKSTNPEPKEAKVAKPKKVVGYVVNKEPQEVDGEPKPTTCQYAGESYVIPEGETKFDDLPCPPSASQRILADHASVQLQGVSVIWKPA